MSPIMRSNTGMCCWVFGNEAKSLRPANHSCWSWAIGANDDEAAVELRGAWPETRKRQR